MNVAGVRRLPRRSHIRKPRERRGRQRIELLHANFFSENVEVVLGVHLVCREKGNICRSRDPVHVNVQEHPPRSGTPTTVETFTHSVTPTTFATFTRSVTPTTFAKTVI